MLVCLGCLAKSEILQIDSLFELRYWTETISVSLQKYITRSSIFSVTFGPFCCDTKWGAAALDQAREIKVSSNPLILIIHRSIFSPFLIRSELVFALRPNCSPGKTFLCLFVDSAASGSIRKMYETPVITGSGMFSFFSSAEIPDPATKPGNSCWGRWLSFGSASAEPVWGRADGRSWGTLTPRWMTGSFPWCSAPEPSLKNREDERRAGCEGRISERPPSY